MHEWLESARQMMDAARTVRVISAIATLVIGLVLARIVRGSLTRVLFRRFEAQEAMVVGRLAFYVLAVLVVASALHQVGFKLGVLLGAAGVATVALGFAAQTSISNLISGLFLIAERPFVVGDLIRVDDVNGTVLSVDLLSVKLRTFDNLFVRIPNESLIKTRITNLTRFPIRRIDLRILVAHKENIARVREILFAVADQNPICLHEPKPILILQGLGDFALELQLSVWVKRQNFLDLKNTIQEEIQKAFEAAGIQIPFPHRTLYSGSTTAPFPVTIVEPTSPSR